MNKAACMAVGKKAHNNVHGLTGTPEYRAWRNMRDRCQRPQNRNWKNYGGRGITVDPRWEDFTVFIADMGRKPYKRATIERMNNDGNYCPENCCWASRKQQSNNTRAAKYNRTIYERK